MRKVLVSNTIRHSTTACLTAFAISVFALIVPGGAAARLCGQCDAATGLQRANLIIKGRIIAEIPTLFSGSDSSPREFLIRVERKIQGRSVPPYVIANAPCLSGPTRRGMHVIAFLINGASGYWGWLGFYDTVGDGGMIQVSSENAVVASSAPEDVVKAELLLAAHSSDNDIKVSGLGDLASLPGKAGGSTGEEF